MNLELEILVKCPYCGGEAEIIGGWGSCPTSTRDVRCYRCKGCKGTFNPAKIPYWRDKVGELLSSSTRVHYCPILSQKSS